MTTYGVSYARGIFYYAPQQGIAHAMYEGGEIKTEFFPWGVRGVLYIGQRVLITLPWYMYLLVLGLLVLGVMPEVTAAWPLPPVPLYSLLLLALGYHFIFPLEMRRFHGAEHKVFSYRSRVHIRDLPDVERADIVNRGCSTNVVVLYYLVFLALIGFVNGWVATAGAVLAMLLVPRLWRWCDRRIIFPISAWLQKHLTTAEPLEMHLKVAILSYVSLRAGRALTEAEAWEEASY